MVTQLRDGRFEATVRFDIDAAEQYQFDTLDEANDAVAACEIFRSIRNDADTTAICDERLEWAASLIERLPHPASKQRADWIRKRLSDRRVHG